MEKREPQSLRRTNSLPPRSQTRILNERRMFGNKQTERESGKTSKGEAVKIFFFFFSSSARRAFLKLAVVWLSVKVEGKTPVE